MRYLLAVMLVIVVAGCTASKVYHRPLSVVSRTIDALEPQMVADVSPDCKKLGIFTNQEPTAVGAVRSAVAVHAASRRWLSFFR